MESNVRTYCRSFPEVFEKASGALLVGETGRRYLDFFSGAGALNYGHNNPYIKQRVVEYLQSDNILHALDMSTTAKRQFMTAFRDHILQPRGLDYNVQFCGPTGTNAVEAALKLARKVTRRTGVFSFVGGFHGMSLGALAITSNRASRAAAGVPLHNATFMPYPNGAVSTDESIDYIDQLLRDGHSGTEKPAAMILETVQAEGGVNVAPDDWLQRLQDLCRQHEILLICDDIQVGCFRTGPFFSFERAKIVPDIVVLSKSIGGIGLPMSLVLMKPELDVWAPGEHTGTFRGNQIAFVAAKAAIEFAVINRIDDEVRRKEGLLREVLHGLTLRTSREIEVRGVGMIWGVDLTNIGGAELARQVGARCFELGLIIERAGRDDTVMKLIPPLTIADDLLQEGCEILTQAITEVSGECFARRTGT
jgi:diaminobutyrate-2-oxoglutarate transaminase